MTFFQTVLASGLPILSVNESDGSEPIFSRALTDAEAQSYALLKMQYYEPTAYAELVELNEHIQDFKNTYIQALARLQQIETTAPSGTQAQILNQIVSAVQDMAKYQRKTLIGLRKLLG